MKVSLSSTVLILSATLPWIPKAFSSVVVPSQSQQYFDKNGLHVVEGFLSDEREIQEFLKVFQDTDNIHVPSSTGKVSINRFGTVGKAFVRRVLAAGATNNNNNSNNSCKPEVESTCNAHFDLNQEDFNQSTTTTVLMRTIQTGATPLHRDRYWDDESTPVLEEVGFVFLNSNPDATFIYGSEQRVTAKKGSLVTFNGSVPHHTVVNSGEVHMVGPFRVDPSMAFVGDIPDPTPAPTLAPTPAPTRAATPAPTRAATPAPVALAVGEEGVRSSVAAPAVGKKGVGAPVGAPAVGKKGVGAPVGAPAVGKKGVGAPVGAPAVGKKGVGAPVGAPAVGKKGDDLTLPPVAGKKGLGSPVAGKKGVGGLSETIDDEMENEEETTEEGVDSLDRVFDSIQAQGMTQPALAGTIFAVLLGVLLCVNVTFLLLFWRSKKRSGGDSDPYGTTVTVSDLKDGRVLVKKVIPGTNGGEEVVEKTVYPDRKTAAGHGFVAGM
ncbi:hypothetical protein IV203_021492 [Nitzschia inconspicua]|uniref:Uncharacterized protein n=1 Tax=Nitzschia inconspicua TaxID=303405 RepID=A0A9K3KH00_9STRA|nr:hypothetical protein IV203_022689 [Nitzschia inconspicua]KAG7343547.1 hypothetical protein IV203_021492 [Nitzschia inconspicua]